MGRYINKLIGFVFSGKMLKHLILIFVSASIPCLYEAMAFSYLQTNSLKYDATKSPLSLAYFLLIPYIFSQFLFRTCSCRTCFDFADYGSPSARRCGSLLNFLILGLNFTFVFLSAFYHWHLFTETFPMQALVTFMAGFSQTLLRKQRKSLAYQYEEDRLFYEATLIVEDFVCLTYMAAFFTYIYVD